MDRSPQEHPLGEEQLRRLLDVGRALVAELDIEVVLRRVLEVASALTGARYAAVGVLDRDGRGLERFLTQGIDESTRRAIGSLPRGHGVLGVLIDNPEPLRLTDVGRHPRSYGFPAGHPPMASFLGVPIRIHGQVYGNLYLTEKDGGDFTEADQEVVSVLADWAAIAIDNARAYGRERGRRGELERAVAGLEATLDINRVLGGETELDRVLELICKRARALVDARLVVILLADEARECLDVSATAGEGTAELLGSSVPVEGSLTGRVLTSGAPTRLTEVGGRLRHSLGDLVEARHGLLMPLVFRGRAVGVLCAFDRHDGEQFSDDDESLISGFAASAAVAVATAQRFAEQGRRRTIEASERERARWARELHDETLQELAGLKVLLSSARSQVDAPALETALDQIDMCIAGLRQLITELRPAALDEYGTAAAVEALLERVRATSGVEVAASVALAWEGGLAETRHEAEVENTIYRLVQEALTNVARHADATHAWVTIEEGRADVRVEVRDDGNGMDLRVQTGGFGLVGMRERVELVGGSLDIVSAPAEGTTVRAVIPARRRSAGPQLLRESAAPSDGELDEAVG